jgi:transcriptional regulator with XRE-family HTH domain
MRSSDELGALLRHWRERVTPDEVGLIAGPGRRVPGLRREEVARLAGVSTDYLAQLEQGRSGMPSVQVPGCPGQGTGRFARGARPEPASLR